MRRARSYWAPGEHRKESKMPRTKRHSCIHRNEPVTEEAVIPPHNHSVSKRDYAIGRCCLPLENIDNFSVFVLWTLFSVLDPTRTPVLTPVAQLVYPDPCSSVGLTVADSIDLLCLKHFGKTQWRINAKWRPCKIYMWQNLNVRPCS